MATVMERYVLLKPMSREILGLVFKHAKCYLQVSIYSESSSLVIP